MKRNVIHLQFVLVLIAMIMAIPPVIAQNSNRVDSLSLSLNYSKSEPEKLILLLELAEELMNNNPEQSLKYVDDALSISQNRNDKSAEVQALIIMSEIYWGMTDFKSALELATEAKLWAEKNGMHAELAMSYRLLGLNYVDLGDYKKASEHFFNSLKTFENIQDKEGMAMATSSIGYVYFDQENYDKALEYYFNSLNLAKEINDKVGISRGLNNIAAVYGNKGEFEKAQSYIKQAIEINLDLGNKQWVGINYMNLGLTSQEFNQSEEALMYFNKALVIFQELDNTIWQAKCNLNIGAFYIEHKNYDQAFNYSKLALQKAENHNMRKIALDAYGLYRDVYLAQGDTNSAYKYTLMIIEASDSLNVEKNKALLSKLEMQYQFEKKEQEERISQQKSDFIKIIIILSLGFALIIIILLWARQRVKSKNVELEKSVLEEKLEHKNKEFTLHVMSLMKKNEILTNMTDKLLHIGEEAVKDETKDAIKRIVVELQNSTDDEIWDEFELRFSQVHSGFYARLLEKHPTLSPSEQKLCAFLRLNMTTKDISELTGQSINTLETARYRLRKKLDLVNSQVNLITFLSQI
ncbi:tetratricopeptide repeat protein [Lentimicrobium sp. L6]|uniref:tetratricopeptide repeat protein n=1 Tax=Lentimicrobium sp. L6 TaxID=2735916 RepID=UPI001551FCC8|nr:tetratricopeptide repeat protein [Lentimicrobium sp. L6]NPD83353.1 tetratricopeptide repeat protein [Lentimicrobium sp. L6]